MHHHMWVTNLNGERFALATFDLIGQIRHELGELKLPHNTIVITIGQFSSENQLKKQAICENKNGMVLFKNKKQ